MNNQIPQIFNRKLLRYVKSKHIDIKNNFLCQYGVEILQEKLMQNKLKCHDILHLGCFDKEFDNFIKHKYPNSNIIYGHYSAAYLEQIPAQHKVVMDEELIPLAAQKFDLIISSLNLHHINDLAGSLIQLRHLLKDKGLFLAVMLGGSSLSRLREAVLAADSKLGGASPKIAPFIDIKTMGNLLKRAGFYMNIIDSQNLDLEYNNIESLLLDLKNIGEVNILQKKSRSLMGKNRLELIKKIYQERFSLDGNIINNLELINITSFKS